MNLDRGLVVLGGREDLRLAARDGRVPLDQLGHHSTLGLDAEGEGGDVQQQHVLDVTGQHACLDGSANCDGFVGVHALMRLFAGQLGHLLADGRHAGHAADQHDVINGRIGVAERLLHRSDHPVEQFGRELVELGPGELDVEMLGLAFDCGDEGNVDLGLLGGGQLDLRLLGSLVETLERVLVGRQVNSLVLLELRDQPVNDRLVEVVATEVVVAGGRLHVEDAVADLQYGHVEGAAAEVEDQDGLIVVFLVEAVGKRSRGRLVDDALDVESGDLAGVLGRLALVVVEVGRDGDHGRVDGLAELRLGVGFQLAEDHRADLGRRVLLAAHVDAHVPVRAGFDLVRDHRLLFLDFGLLAAHEALDREDRVFRVHHGLALGYGADQPLVLVIEGDHRRGGAPALGVLENGRFAAFENRYARVGRAEVDSYRLSHCVSPVWMVPGRMRVRPLS